MASKPSTKRARKVLGYPRWKSWSAGRATVRLYLSANLNMMLSTVLLAVLWVLRNMTFVLAWHGMGGIGSSSWLFEMLQEGNRWGKGTLVLHPTSET